MSPKPKPTVMVGIYDKGKLQRVIAPKEITKFDKVLWSEFSFVDVLVTPVEDNKSIIKSLK